MKMHTTKQLLIKRIIEQKISLGMTKAKCCQTFH